MQAPHPVHRPGLRGAAQEPGPVGDPAQPVAAAGTGTTAVGAGFSAVMASSLPSRTTLIRSVTDVPGPACLRALLSASCTMRYASRETSGGSASGSASMATATPRPPARVRRSRPSRSAASVGEGAGVEAEPGTPGAPPGESASRNTPSTASSSPTVRRVVSSIAASASRTNSGSLSRTRRAALAWSVTALSAWPTESCSSRASRLRTARSAAWASAAASRSSGVGPSRSGAQRASSAPAPAAEPARAASIAAPATGESANAQVWSKISGRSSRESRSATKSGSTISTTAKGGVARDIPAITPPNPRCSVNHTAVRPFAWRVRAGPSARRSPSTPHRARTTATDIGRVSGNSPVIAASGSPAPKAKSWWGSELNRFSEFVNGPTISSPTKTYGMASAPPRIRWIHRRRVRLPNRVRASAVTSTASPGRRHRRPPRGCRRSSDQRR